MTGPATAAGWHVALLRAVNVGGRNLVAMSDLRDLLAGLGLKEPRTLLQSGNAVFRGAGRTGSQLERLLEREAGRRLGLATSFFVRTAEEWAEAIECNPFPEEAERDPSHLVVVALRQAPEASAGRALQAAIAGRERVKVVGRQAYVVYPDGSGRSRVTLPFLEKALGQGTGRNWNTVLKLSLLAPTGGR